MVNTPRKLIYIYFCGTVLAFVWIFVNFGMYLQTSSWQCVIKKLILLFLDQNICCPDKGLFKTETRRLQINYVPLTVDYCWFCFLLNFQNICCGYSFAYSLKKKYRAALLSEGLLSVTSESMCTKYWLTA